MKLEWCLSHPVRPGTVRSKSYRQTDIHTSVRTGDECGAQVVLTSENRVAKIYDPLYYPVGNADSGANTAADADNDFLSKVAAYTVPEEAMLEGGVVPKFFDAWSTKEPLIVEGKHVYREIRLILLEYVADPRMADLRPQQLE